MIYRATYAHNRRASPSTIPCRRALPILGAHGVLHLRLNPQLVAARLSRLFPSFTCPCFLNYHPGARAGRRNELWPEA